MKHCQGITLNACCVSNHIHLRLNKMACDKQRTYNASKNDPPTPSLFLVKSPRKPRSSPKRIPHHHVDPLDLDSFHN